MNIDTTGIVQFSGYGVKANIVLYYGYDYYEM